MRKIVLFLCCVMYFQTSNAWEFGEDENFDYVEYKSVAWNFVMSIVNEDYVLMEELMAPDYRDEVRRTLLSEGLLSYKELFVPELIHDIVGMRPLMRDGWKLEITNVYKMKHGEYYSKDVYLPYRGWDARSVCFECVPTSENIKYYDPGEVDGTARVILVKIGDKWKVVGFK